MKLLFTIVAVLNFLSIVPFGLTIDELRYVEEEYTDLCNDYSVTLHFSYNRITNNSISSPTLRCLSMENSEIEGIEEAAFIWVPNLQYLSLQGNQIPTEDLFSFGNLSNVKKLILSNQRNWNYLATTVVRGVYPQLVYLDLKNVKLNKISSQQENPFPNLTYLDLSWNAIENFNFVNILSERLTSLYLNANAISRISLTKLSNLSLLSLDDNKIEVIGNDYGLNLMDLTNLRNLSVRSNRISVIEKEAFKDTVRLRHLDISNNSLSAIHSETFDYLGSLTVLILDGNMFTEIPTVVATQWQLTMSLTTLSMNYNRIQFLSENELFNLPNLTKLSLTGNMIWHVNTNTFQRQYKLEELYLDNNELLHLPDGWCATMHNLRYLQLEGNKFTSLESMYLATASSLRQVYFSCNNLKYFNASVIKAIPENLTIYLDTDYVHSNRSISTCKLDTNFS